MRKSRRKRTAALLALILCSSPLPSFATPIHAVPTESGVSHHQAAAETALEKGKLDEALVAIDRVLERDSRLPRAWELRAQWAKAAGNRDERVYSLHRHLGLSVSQGLRARDLDALRDRVEEEDAVGRLLLRLRDSFVKRLEPIAKQCEKDRRPHAAIRAHQQILALDPERAESREAIERISAQPDPSLAETAKPRDLLADISEEWIKEHDKKHLEWDEAAVNKGENYITVTNAGYEVLVRSAEAMDQMNAFYRLFFQHGHDGKKSVPRIRLHIFKNRDEYLEQGIGPPVKWSGGHFTGGAVETYVGGRGFEGTVGTLFHEAAHQFVSLATTATGWLNEGLASFFEGCRIQANGTVLMNMPANHRLFALVTRMRVGWMKAHDDGIDPEDPSKSNPRKAPTFRIIIENEYEWGPAWYAPTWGVVYFLYNYQDPADGRFVYRKAFREFINSSGGRKGKGAIKNFESVVLAQPAPPANGWERPADAPPLVLPKTVDDLDALWKDWMIALREEQSGSAVVDRPYLAWARHALARNEPDIATEHFEKGLVNAPLDADLLLEFGAHLAGRTEKNPDRAAKLLLQGLRVLEAADPRDDERVVDVARRLAKLDPNRRTLRRIQRDLADRAHTIVTRYLEDELYLMAMDTAWRFGNDLNVPGMFDLFEQAARRAPRSLSLWQLAYNEQNLEGWTPSNSRTFTPSGENLVVDFGEYTPGRYDYQSIGLERVTSGDFSLEAEVFCQSGIGTFVGVLFGRKSDTAYHSAIFFPATAEEHAKDGMAQKAYVDLTSFYEAGQYKIWRHNAVGDIKDGWHTLRVDIAGTMVDLWFDGQLLTTHEFPHRDVLQGSFGLITGPGSSMFRRVRFLARNAGDPTAKIERELRMERVFTPGRSVNGSWLNQVPPWIDRVDWLQAPRASWAEAGPSPQLIVFWSLKQDGMVPLRPWLTHLTQKYADVGLRIVSVCQNEKTGVIEQSLADAPFPGSVARDHFERYKSRYGVTFERFDVGEKFNLPRLLLLDVNQQVIWEGTPGFEMGKPWKEGVETYLDAPLEDLMVRRKLREVATWRNAWKTDGAKALADRDFAKLEPLLRAASTLPETGFPVLSRVRRVHATILRAATQIDETAHALADAGREPAIKELVGWSALVDKPVNLRAVPYVKSRISARNPSMADWKKALGLAKEARKTLEDDAAVVDGAALAAKIARLKGAFPAKLAQQVTAAGDDREALQALLDGAARLPARWLLEEHFHLE